MSSRLSDPCADLCANLRARPEIACQENAPLAPRTHVRIGGPAEVLVEPASITAVAEAVAAVRQRALPLFVLAGGSNLLVADPGVRGVVLSVRRLDSIVRDGVRVTAGAGVPLPRLLRVTREAGLSGLESLTGIPARVGGAVAMNAGTRDGDTFAHLETVQVLDPDGRTCVRARRDLQPHYRDGGLGPDLVLAATFILVKDDPSAIQARFAASLRRRNATQPVSRQSVGCVFRNPDGAPAARLIDEAGCKGMRSGAIVVSERHANYFVNEGGGTCAEYRSLMERVRRRVFEHSGCELRAEVKVWGG